MWRPSPNTLKAYLFFSDLFYCNFFNYIYFPYEDHFATNTRVSIAGEFASYQGHSLN